MAQTAAVPAKRRKQYSAGFVIWTIIKYFSLIFFAFVAILPIVSCDLMKIINILRDHSF